VPLQVMTSSPQHTYTLGTWRGRPVAFSQRALASATAAGTQSKSTKSKRQSLLLLIISSHLV
jgi:hypothetical protein